VHHMVLQTNTLSATAIQLILLLRGQESTNALRQTNLERSLPSHVSFWGDLKTATLVSSIKADYHTSNFKPQIIDCKSIRDLRKRLFCHTVFEGVERTLVFSLS
jgi:hypothetical protein